LGVSPDDIKSKAVTSTSSGSSSSSSVDVSLSTIEDNEDVDSPNDDVFVSKNVSKTTANTVNFSKTTDSSGGKGKSKRSRCASENAQRGSRSNVSPPSSALRGILKRRVRSYSESHVGSLEECLGENLLHKYSTVEEALVKEYGCLEHLLEECGWEESSDGEGSTSPTKKVTFSDVEKKHLFLSKMSILQQLSKDSKKASRKQMKEEKRRKWIERRHGGSHSYDGGSSIKFRSSRDEDCSLSYTSCEEVTTDEECGGDSSTTTCGDSSGSDTEARREDKPSVMPPSKLLPRKKKNGKARKNNRRSDASTNMVFQLDIDS